MVIWRLWWINLLFEVANEMRMAIIAMAGRVMMVEGGVPGVAQVSSSRSQDDAHQLHRQLVHLK
jgi:hypothetical protein